MYLHYFLLYVLLMSLFSFILANTAELHDKISQLSERVRLLEDALQHATSPSHPLLAPELLSIKTTPPNRASPEATASNTHSSQSSNFSQDHPKATTAMQYSVEVSPC